jgi:hypothetical protein
MRVSNINTILFMSIVVKKSTLNYTNKYNKQFYACRT